MQTILGASGTIGNELAKSLTSYTSAIRLVSRHPKKIHETDELLAADLTQREQVFNAVRGSEVCYLTVGLPYKLKIWKKEWPALMQNTIDACIEYGSRLVFFDNVYMIGGDNVKHITEASPISPTSRKGTIRAALDRMIMRKIDDGKLTATIARCADFYGGKGSTSVLMELVYKNLHNNKKAQWLFNAKVKHSFTYAPDAAKATAMLGNDPATFNQVWNLPTDHNALTGEQWVSLFANKMGKPDRYMLLPAWLMRAMGIFVPALSELYEMRYQYDRDYFFDSSKFERYFHFTPTANEEGVQAAISQQ